MSKIIAPFAALFALFVVHPGSVGASQPHRQSSRVMRGGLLGFALAFAGPLVSGRAMGCARNFIQPHVR